MSIIVAYASHYEIDDVYELPQVILTDLTKWDPLYFRNMPIGFHYDEDTKVLRIPRGYPESSIQSMFPEHRLIHSNEIYDYDKINIGLMSPPRNYRQEHVLAFMLSQSPYDYTRKYTQLYVDLDTGDGKTFCGIASICFYQCRGVIFIPAISKIGNQWMESIERFTTLKPNEYLFVRGSSMCKKIIKGDYPDVKIFVIPRSTVLSFIRKFDNDWNMLERLVKAMNVGVKIIDEAHMDFHTIVNIDCFTNVAKTYYMSSSPSRSDFQEKGIYKKIFDGVPKHGKELKSKEQNHIVPLILFFRSTPSDEWLKVVKNRYGISQAKYGEYLLADDGAKDEFLDAYIYALHTLMKMRRRNGKILVLCITIEFANKLAEFTKSVFPKLSTGLFVGMAGEEKNKELDNDIIFSTVKSMGTGSEIVNHQHTINTITYASDVMADQISGRIRAQDKRKGIYCELVNINHKFARKHYSKREPYLIKKAKNGKLLTYNITNQDIDDVWRFINDGKYIDGDGLTHCKDGKILIQKRRCIL